MTRKKAKAAVTIVRVRNQDGVATRTFPRVESNTNFLNRLARLEAEGWDEINYGPQWISLHSQVEDMKAVVAFAKKNGVES